MIVAKITTGLGNQLFQYALARNLSLLNKTQLYFDISHYHSNHLYPALISRKFKLHHFDIHFENIEDSRSLYLRKVVKHLPVRSLKPFFRIIHEQQFHFDKKVLEAKARLIDVEGFWQSEKYFEGCADTVRKELTFKNRPGENFDRYRREIQNCSTPVSLHIRRGDYVHRSESSEVHGFLGLEYYRRALDVVKRKLSDYRLFLFSDDIEWVEKKFNLESHKTVVKNTGENSDVDDLHLMSLCKHNIIANSSFSWWGAWLNNHKDKMVISPEKWFNNMPTWNTKDLVPSSWLRI